MWKPIPETGGWYEASDEGRIRNVPRQLTVHRKGRKYVRSFAQKEMKQHTLRRKATAPPYAFVYLRYPDGSRRRRAVHALVLDAFVGPREPWQQCRHLDGDSLNNRLENLKWGSPAENRADTRRHGRIARGQTNGRSSLTNEEVLALRIMHSKGMSTYQLAEWFGVSPTAASRIARGLSWPKLVAALEAAP